MQIAKILETLFQKKEMIMIPKYPWKFQFIYITFPVVRDANKYP